MTRRPLVLATRRHPMSLAVYLGMLVLAVLYLTDVTRPMALTSLTTSTDFPTLFAAGLGLASLTALVGASTPRGRLTGALLAEAIGCTGVAVSQATYVASLVVGSPGDTPYATATFALAVTVGCAARAWQCLQEVGRTRAAVAVGAPADPPPLAEASPSKE